MKIVYLVQGEYAREAWLQAEKDGGVQ